MNAIKILTLSLILLGCNPGGYFIDCEDCGFVCLSGDDRNVIRNDCQPNDDCSFRVFPNSKINTKEVNGIGKGELNVYQMKTLRKAIPGFTQDVSNTLLFEMDPRVKTFRINGEEFSKLNVHFKKVSPNNNIDFVPASLGCIAGEEQASGVWFMFGKVSVPNPDGIEEIKFEARFD